MVARTLNMLLKIRSVNEIFVQAFNSGKVENLLALYKPFFN